MSAAPPDDAAPRAGAGRRVVASVVFLAGGALIAWSLRRLPLDLNRALVALVLTLTGIVLSGLVAVGRRPAVSTWLRGVALGVGVVALIAMVASLVHFRFALLPTIPKPRRGLREAIEVASQSLVCVIAALVYLIGSVCLLRRARTAREHGRPERWGG